MRSSFAPPAPLRTAVLFLVFNRPDTTARLFEAIRQAKPPRLYVAADGPREGREGEAEPYDFSLRALYSAADAMVIPSRQDNLPNTGVEAHACATPVTAFNAGGLPDIVEHDRTGYLAKAFDTEELAYGISWVLAQRDTGQLGKHARERVEARFTASLVADMYKAIYRSL
jgi:glycosyltransferase involved in cell wall biosynthesis